MKSSTLRVWLNHQPHSKPAGSHCPREFHCHGIKSKKEADRFKVSRMFTSLKWLTIMNSKGFQYEKYLNYTGVHAAMMTVYIIVLHEKALNSWHTFWGKTLRCESMLVHEVLSIRLYWNYIVCITLFPNYYIITGYLIIHKSVSFQNSMLNNSLLFMLMYGLFVNNPLLTLFFIITSTKKPFQAFFFSNYLSWKSNISYILYSVDLFMDCGYIWALLNWKLKLFFSLRTNFNPPRGKITPFENVCDVYFHKSKFYRTMIL